MSNKARYTQAINRLTVIASNIDYDRLFKGMPERKYNRVIARTYNALNTLHDLLKYAI